jgi:hypothetical protein
MVLGQDFEWFFNYSLLLNLRIAANIKASNDARRWTCILLGRVSRRAN